MIVKRGDRHPISWTVGGDGTVELAGATLRLLVRNQASGALVELPATVTGTDTVTHTLDGTLTVGTYQVEVEVTQGAEIRTVPTEDVAYLYVVPDLG